jgi:drug/metabolite transporter (DMT)-like permease
MVVAAGQLVCSSAVMLPVALIVDQPWKLAMPGSDVVLSLLGLAVISTAFAYIMFFRILKGAGAINVSLVTLLIPISAIAMGVLFLGDLLVAKHIFGAIVIGCALLVIDGRLFSSGNR